MVVEDILELLCYFMNWSLTGNRLTKKLFQIAKCSSVETYKYKVNMNTKCNNVG